MPPSLPQSIVTVQPSLPPSMPSLCYIQPSCLPSMQGLLTVVFQTDREARLAPPSLPPCLVNQMIDHDPSMVHVTRLLLLVHNTNPSRRTWLMHVRRCCCWCYWYPHCAIPPALLSRPHAQRHASFALPLLPLLLSPSSSVEAAARYALSSWLPAAFLLVALARGEPTESGKGALRASKLRL